MVDGMSIADSDAGHTPPGIRTIGLADLGDALAKGLDDFNAKPSHIFLLVLIYPILGLFAFRLTFGYELLPLLFPILTGFALIGPLAAIGLYELSRLREQGREISWAKAANVVRSPSIKAIMALAIVQLVIYFLWLGTAFAIYKMIFGNAVPTSIFDFAHQVMTTPSGWALVVVGCGVGFLFALLVLIISVVSFPMLVDRKVSALTAVQTSVRAFFANPIPMLTWGLIVALALAIGSLPLLLGLVVVMPVLGHATWHLYRKVVVWDGAAHDSA